MVLELVVFFLIVIPPIFRKKIYCLYLIVTLIPFHSFIKYFFALNGGGDVFSYWKEIVILIFIFKAFNHNQRKLNNYFLGYFILLICFLSLYIFVNLENLNYGLAKFRDIVFPILLFLGISVSNIKESQIRKFVYLFSLSFLIIGITGIMDVFFGYRDVFALVTGKIEAIGIDGEKYYPASMMIMGFNRMTGILEGPNQLGLYASTFILLIVGLKGKYKWENFKDKFVAGTAIFGIFVLLFSFSRTAIATVMISLFFLFNNKRTYKNLFVIFLVVILTSGVLSFFFPQIQDVYLGTLQGKEASSADRSNNFQQGINFILKQPLGHGLGSSHPNKTGETQVYFAESTFINLCVEIGISGFLLLMGYYLLVLHKLKRFRGDLPKISSAILITTLITSFFSVNPSESLYTYIIWIIIGFSFSKIIKDVKYENIG